MPPRKRRRAAEDDPVTEVVDQLMDHPQTQRVLDRAAAFFDGFGELIDRTADRALQRGLDLSEQRIRKAMAERVAAPRVKAVPKRPPPPPPPAPKESARQVLGFGPTEAVTAGQVKDRQRALAKILHPDKGGNTSAMQRINEAATALLKEIRP